MENISSRIKKLRKTLGLTQTEMAKKIGISRSHVANMERNEREPRSIHLMAMHDRLGVSEDWLMTGEGDMFENRIMEAAGPAEQEKKGMAMDIPDGPRLEGLSSNPHGAAFWADMQEGVKMMSGIIARQADRSLQKPVLPYHNMYMNAKGCLEYMQRAMDRLERQWQQDMQAMFDGYMAEATASSLRADVPGQADCPNEKQ